MNCLISTPYQLPKRRNYLQENKERGRRSAHAHEMPMPWGKPRSIDFPWAGAIQGTARSGTGAKR